MWALHLNWVKSTVIVAPKCLSTWWRLRGLDIFTLLSANPVSPGSLPTQMIPLSPQTLLSFRPCNARQWQTTALRELSEGKPFVSAKLTSELGLRCLLPTGGLISFKQGCSPGPAAFGALFTPEPGPSLAQMHHCLWGSRCHLSLSPD